MRDALPFVVLASGQGTNARALFHHALNNPGRLRPVLLVSDRPGAPALEIAEEFGVPHFVVDSKNEGAMIALLRRHSPQWACLAGYKKLVGQGFLDFFRDESLGFSRVMNVHPSLLPAYPGLNGYERAFRDGVKLSGVTVHLVDNGLDTGRAILQEAFSREDEDTLATFTARGREVEHRLYAQALDLAAEWRIRMISREDCEFVSIG